MATNLHAVSDGACREPATSGRPVAARLLAWVPPLAVLVGLAVYGAIKCQYGIDVSDEGFYVSVPIRYLLGDVPFRDQWDNSLKMYDLLLWGFFALFPQAGLYQTRLLGLALELASLAAMFLLLRRFVSPSVCALACIAAAFMGYGINTPGYNKLARVGLCLALALWLHACHTWDRPRGRRWMVVPAGAWLVAGMVAYAPLVCLLIVPLAVAALAHLRLLRRKAVRAATDFFLLGTLGFGLLFVAALAAGGILDDYIWLFKWDATAQSDSARGLGVARRLTMMGQRLSLLLPFIVGLWAGLWPVCAAFTSGGGIWRRLAGLAALGLVVGIGRATFTAGMWRPAVERWGHDASGFWMLCVSVAFLGVALTLRLTRGVPWRELPRAGQWALVRGTILAAGVAFLIVQGTFSLNYYRNVVFAVPLLLLVAVADLCRTLDARQRFLCAGRAAARFRPMTVALAVVVLWLGVMNLRLDFGRVYRDLAPNRLTARFSQRYLKGIRSTPSRVANIEGLLDYLQPRVVTGDYLHMQEEFSMIYFLLRVRPALPNTWSPARRGYSRGHRQRALDFMLDNQRVPEYFVQYRISRDKAGTGDYSPTTYITSPLPDDPIHRYFAEYYEPMRRWGLMEVWRRLPGIGPQPPEAALFCDLGRATAAAIRLPPHGQYYLDLEAASADEAPAVLRLTLFDDPAGGEPTITKEMRLRPGANELVIRTADSAVYVQAAVEGGHPRESAVKSFQIRRLPLGSAARAASRRGVLAGEKG